MRALELLCVPTILFLSAFAPVKSIDAAKVPRGPKAVGLVYHLPLQKLKLIVTVSAKAAIPANDPASAKAAIPAEARTAAEDLTLVPDVETSEAYPDPDTAYLLKVTHSQFGNTQLNIGVRQRRQPRQGVCRDRSHHEKDL